MVPELCFWKYITEYNKTLTESPQADTMAFTKILHVPWQRVDVSVTLLFSAVKQTVLLLNVPTAVTQAAGSSREPVDVGEG